MKKNRHLVRLKFYDDLLNVNELKHKPTILAWQNLAKLAKYVKQIFKSFGDNQIINSALVQRHKKNDEIKREK